MARARLALLVMSLTISMNAALPSAPRSAERRALANAKARAVGTVRAVRSEDELSRILASSKARLVVLDFYADWCGSCKQLAPFLDRLARRHAKTCVFLKCDVDAHRELAQITYGVKSMPTLLFFRRGELVGRVSGADEAAILAQVRLATAPKLLTASLRALSGPRVVLGALAAYLGATLVAAAHASAAKAKRPEPALAAE